MASKKIILVTGANSGIGYSTSAALATSANNHVILGCRSLTKGNEALEKLQNEKLPGTLSLLELDVTNDRSIDSAVESIGSTHGRLDALVNNAGIVLTTNKDARGSLNEVLNTNTTGPFLLAQALIPLLKKSSDPRIVNVSSGLGSISTRLNEKIFGYDIPAEGYRMSKAAMNMFSVCLYVNNKDWGLKSFVFCPGYVITNLTGEGDRENRKQSGAESSDTSAQGIVEILDGKRDGEVEKFLQRRGETWEW